MSATLTAEEMSKDRYFQSLAKIAEEMVEDHGKDFATGALILAARWIAENRFGRQEGPRH